MQIQTKSLLATAVLASFAAGQQAHAAVTYVDADLTNTVGVVSGLPNWNSGGPGSGDGANSNDGLWRYRGAFAYDGIWESGGGFSENAAELKTTMTGMADGLYNVYVFFYSNAGDDWGVRAGLSSNPGGNTLFDKGTDGGVVREAASTLTFAAGPNTVANNQNTGQTPYYGLVGQVQVTGGASSIDVFIDDRPVPSSSRRAWYEGVGYELASTPLSLMNVDIGVADSGTSNGSPNDVQSGFLALDANGNGSDTPGGAVYTRTFDGITATIDPTNGGSSGYRDRGVEVSGTGVDDMLEDFVFSTGTIVLTLDGLIDGQQYEITTYHHDTDFGHSASWTIDQGDGGSAIDHGTVTGTSGATPTLSDGNGQLTTTFTAGAGPVVLTGTTISSAARLNGYTITLVPEPSSLALLGLGGLFLARRRR